MMKDIVFLSLISWAFVVGSIVSKLTFVGFAYPVEALEEVGKRSIAQKSLSGAGALVTEQEEPRLLKSAQGLPTEKEGLEMVLSGGKTDDGVLASADSLNGCLLRTSQGRRIAILYGFLDRQAWTEISEPASQGAPPQKKTSIVVEISQASDNTGATPFQIISLDDYPFASLRAQIAKENNSENKGVTIIDDSKANDADNAANIQHLCDAPNENGFEVKARGERIETVINVSMKPFGEVVTSPWSSIPSNQGLVRVRYKTYEVVLQVIAVALLLLDLFILENLETKRLRIRHVLGIGLLLLATIVTTVLGYLEILETLSTQTFAWESCVSYDFLISNSSFDRRGIIYKVFCEWVVIRATSTPASFLIFAPSAVGAVALILVIICFLCRRCMVTRLARREPGNIAETNEAESQGETFLSTKEPPGKMFVPKGFAQTAVLCLILTLVCHGESQKFPPSAVERVGGDFKANDEVLFVAGVAVTTIWRCAWESPIGPTSDNRSLSGVDDCFLSWRLPTEDQKTRLLIGKAELKLERCFNENRICPWVGRKCPLEEKRFKCAPRLKVPKSLTFFRQWQVQMVTSMCAFKGGYRKTLCRLRLLNILSKWQLRRLTHQLKTRLGDERVNVHRISEYVFPDCAGPPKTLSGSDAGTSTLRDHDSARGKDCVNSKDLSRIARSNIRNECHQIIRQKFLCKDLPSYITRGSCKREILSLCVETFYTSAVAKSRLIRAVSDWLVSRCHQSGNTKFGRLRGNWKANEDAVVDADDKIPRESDLPLVRPVQHGWRYGSVKVPDFLAGK